MFHPRILFIKRDYRLVQWRRIEIDTNGSEFFRWLESHFDRRYFIILYFFVDTKLLKEMLLLLTFLRAFFFPSR